SRSCWSVGPTVFGRRGAPGLDWSRSALMPGWRPKENRWGRASGRGNSIRRCWSCHPWPTKCEYWKDPFMSLNLAPHVSAVHVESGSVLLNQKTGRYWQINGSASTILAILTEGGTVEEACQRLTDEYEVERPQAERDVRTLLDGLLSAGLVKEQ